ncbi:sensor histidine kinase [Flavicella sediminum]|uniref:sensor histidine kinase n=1 Tax=Flavicella sediminum TaxID=2585141 RepID=UPI00112488BC|nr:HAMP domain-containing sensor histidine kinase [Flavicella sediminum]
MKKIYSKNIVVLVSFGIVLAILWTTYSFSNKIKQDERTKMEILAKAYDRFGGADLDQDLSLEMKIIGSNDDIPMIVTDEKGKILMHRNLDSIKATDSAYLKNELELMRAQNKPIVVNYLKDKQNNIHYRDSNLLTRLKYYPLTLVIILILFSGVVYLIFKSNKISEQNKLWSGMAKETAHQIGTPLSSLLGWVELMKLQHIGPEIVPEIEKDVQRLNVIAERFSQIGSVPDLVDFDIVGLIKNTVLYFEARSSKNVHFNFRKPKKQIEVKINEQLFTWVLENLIKNAIDAMSGKGDLAIVVTSNRKFVKIRVSDSGKGMPRSQFKKVFVPGYTTKKRGWGLGLSLSKRIVEDYHNGKIQVLKSEVNSGTTFEVLLPRI